MTIVLGIIILGGIAAFAVYNIRIAEKANEAGRSYESQVASDAKSAADTAAQKADEHTS